MTSQERSQVVDELVSSGLVVQEGLRYRLAQPLAQHEATPAAQIQDSPLPELGEGPDQVALPGTDQEVRAARNYVIECLTGPKFIDAGVIYRLTGWPEPQVRRFINEIHQEIEEQRRSETLERQRQSPARKPGPGGRRR